MRRKGSMRRPDGNELSFDGRREAREGFQGTMRVDFKGQTAIAQF